MIHVPHPTTAISNTITMSVATPLGATGAINGATTTQPNTLQLYSIAAVSGATNYIWTVPAGWTIDSGQGTTTINTTSGAIGQNGNITVTVGNSCETNPQEYLAVEVTESTKHLLYNCSSCHITHNSPGNNLTNVAGNALLCQSCHTTNGAASSKPLVNGNKAIPGIGGKSHSWNTNGENTIYETLLPLNGDMLARMPESPPITGPKQLICSTCHNQHNNGNAGIPYLRIANDNDEMCKDCHRIRDVKQFTDPTSPGYGSHPVGITYNGLDSRFNTSQSNTQLSVAGDVECSSCHGVHDIQTP